LPGYPITSSAMVSINGDTVRPSMRAVLMLAAAVDHVYGTVIAVIEQNRFRINQNNIFYAERPNKSELSVYDQHNDQIINVKYLNAREISIFGALYYFWGVKIKPQTLIMPGGGLSDGCFAYARFDMVIN
jgi:hypothetical protein